VSMSTTQQMFCRDGTSIRGKIVQGTIIHRSLWNLNILLDSNNLPLYPPPLTVSLTYFHFLSEAHVRAQEHTRRASGEHTQTQEISTDAPSPGKIFRPVRVKMQYLGKLVFYCSNKALDLIFNIKTLLSPWPRKKRFNAKLNYVKNKFSGISVII
jgi:hypothetical protein